MFLCFFGEKYGEKRKKKNAQNSSQKPNFSVLVQSGVLGAIYSPWHASRGPAHLVGLPGQVGGPSRAVTNVIMTSANLSCNAFLVFTLDPHLAVFLDSNWGDLGVPGKLWMSSFHKAKELKNPTIGSKVMTSGRVLISFSQFSQHLNCFNSNFDPWIVVGMRIWLYSQWHWFKLIWWMGQNQSFWGPSRVNSLSNLVKVAENLWGICVWYKTIKNVVLWEFWHCLTFGQPRVD